MQRARKFVDERDPIRSRGLPGAAPIAECELLVVEIDAVEATGLSKSGDRLDVHCAALRISEDPCHHVRCGAVDDGGGELHAGCMSGGAIRVGHTARQSAERGDDIGCSGLVGKQRQVLEDGMVVVERGKRRIGLPIGRPATDGDRRSRAGPCSCARQRIADQRTEDQHRCRRQGDQSSHRLVDTVLRPRPRWWRSGPDVRLLRHGIHRCVLTLVGLYGSMINSARRIADVVHHRPTVPPAASPTGSCWPGRTVHGVVP